MRKELVIFVGPPAAGKSAFYREKFRATHLHVNDELLRNVKNKKNRQTRMIELALRAGRSVVVDCINSERASRAKLIKMGKENGARVVAYDFSSIRTDLDIEIPLVIEGFDEIFMVKLSDFEFQVGKIAA